MYKLYAKEKFFKFLDDYPILNEHEEAVYHVLQKFSFFLRKVEVYDRHQELCFTIEEQFKFFLKTFRVTFVKNNLTIDIQQKFTWMRDKLEIESPLGSLVVQGDIWNHDYDVLLEDRKIGHISKKFFALTDSYALEIYDAQLEAWILAIMLAIDEINDDRKRSD